MVMDNTFGIDAKADINDLTTMEREDGDGAPHRTHTPAQKRSINVARGHLPTCGQVVGNAWFIAFSTACP